VCGKCTTKNTKSTKEERESGREGDVKVEEAGSVWEECGCGRAVTGSPGWASGRLKECTK
jgi:hypothetical protein